MGRGGVRYNAGRPGWHAKAEDCQSIDARRWQREGILNTHRAGSWVWTETGTGKRVASIGYRSEPGMVLLHYTLNGQPAQQRVPILSTPCTFGGQRQWFACPGCARRVAVLFVRSKGFLCRHCNRVVYASQSEDLIGRLWRRQRKAEGKLAGNWQRPEGMHQRTYLPLLRAVKDCELARDELLFAYMQRNGLLGDLGF